MSDLTSIFQPLSDATSNVEHTKTLEEMVGWLRPASAKDYDSVNDRIRELLQYLKQHPQERELLKSYLSHTLKDYDLHYFFSEYTVLRKTGFFSQLRKRIFRKFIPEAPKQKSLSQLIKQIFCKKKDSHWLAKIDLDLWEALLDVLAVKTTFSSSINVKQSLLQAAKLLSFRIASFGLDDQIQMKYRILNENADAFFEQNRVLSTIYLKLNSEGVYENVQSDFQQAIQLLEDCKEKINILRNRKNEIGTSIELTFLSRQVKYHINRLMLLLTIYNQQLENSFGQGLLTLLQESVRYQHKKNSLRNLVTEYLDLVTLQIVEHTAQKGGKYIAETKAAYWKFLRAAMLGGFIIAIFAMFKIWLDKADLPPFVQGLAFSINYAACFVLVKALGGIIATKQPAMTASSIIKDIDGAERLHSLRDTIIKVNRSQFISFVGNLVLAFPMAILISYAFSEWTDIAFISEYKAEKLLKDLQPIKGGAVYYAAIAGIFLSLSGLISGYFDNKVLFSNIPARVKNIQWLQVVLGSKGLSAFAKYVEKNLGAFMGNVSLGFFLGFSGFIGYITGLPVDIRHIAFSSANFGFVFQPALATEIILTSLLGIFLIGLVNFIVSFGLTLSIALQARNVTFGQSKKLTLLLIKAFFQNPFRFFLPIGAPA